MSAKPESTSKGGDRRAQLYRLLAVGQRELQLDEETYRLILRQYGATEKGGKVSAKTMTVAQLEQALEHLKRSGFKVKRTGTRLSTAKWRKARIAKLNAMWTLLADKGHVRDRSEQAMHRWCVGQVKSLERLEWADGHQLNQAIEALKGWCVRVGLQKEITD